MLLTFFTGGGEGRRHVRERAFRTSFVEQRTRQKVIIFRVQRRVRSSYTCMDLPRQGRAASTAWHNYLSLYLPIWLLGGACLHHLHAPSYGRLPRLWVWLVSHRGTCARGEVPQSPLASENGVRSVLFCKKSMIKRTCVQRSKCPKSKKHPCEDTRLN